MDLHRWSDYTYIGDSLLTHDVPLGGTIIPQEDVDGRECALRREDLAFLHEGISEREGDEFAYSCSRTITKSGVVAIGEKIRSFYERPMFFNPDYDWQRIISATDLDPEDVPGALIDSSNCHIPSTCENPLYGDYLRACYYDLEQLRRIDSYGDTKTDGGNLRLSSIEFYMDGSQYAQYNGSYVHGCGRIQDIESGEGTGYSFSLTKGGTWSLFNGSVYTFSNSFQSIETETEKYNRYEGYYVGYLASVRMEEMDDESPKILIRYKLENVHVNSSTSSTTRTKYCILPAATTTKMTNVEGWKEAYITPNGTNLSDYRSMISAAFPGASFSLASAGNDDYRVIPTGLVILSDQKYKSRINDLHWPWTP